MATRKRFGLAIALVVALSLVAAALGLWLQEGSRGEHRRLDQLAERPDSPCVSGRFAAWSDRAAGGGSVIVFYDSATGTSRRLTSAEGRGSQPALSGRRLVYVDQSRDEGDLVVRGLPDGSPGNLVRAPGRQSAPAADGDWVVWEDDRTSYGPRVRARRFSSGEEVLVPAASPGAVQRRPKVGSGYVVWEEYGGETTAATSPKIYGYDLETRRRDAIATSDTIQLLPETDGRYVAWAEQRGDQLGVAVWDRRTGARSTAPSGGGSQVEQTAPVVSRGVVHWIQNVGGGAFGVVSWRPGAPASSVASSANAGQRVEFRAAEGSRLWFEYRRGRWFVRADLSGEDTVADESASAPEPVPPSLDLSPGAALGRLFLARAAAAPSAARDVRATVVDGSSVRVSWEAAEDDAGVTSYDVYRSEAAISPATRARATLVTSVEATTVTVPAAPGEAERKFPLYYAVVARDAAGNGTLSANSAPNPHGAATPGVAGDTCTRCHFQGEGGPSPASRRSCYRCHGGTSDTTRYGRGSAHDTAAAFRDDPGATAAETGSRHRNAFMTNTLRECDGCHSPHRRPVSADPGRAYSGLLRVQSATTTAGDGAFRYSTAAAPVGDRFCFECHGANLTPMVLVGGATAYLNAGGDHETGWSQNAHSRVPAPDPATQVRCLACHDAHGSNVPRLLGRWDAASDTNRIGGRALTGNDNSVCAGCHLGASGGPATASRDASGYPVSGTWPGGSVYSRPYSGEDHSGGIHDRAGVVWPGTRYAGGDCKNCHVPHGPSNRYDQLRLDRRQDAAAASSLLPDDFRFCFACHDGGVAPDMRRFYPSAVGGTATSATAGHRTRSAGLLPAGSPLPCYDCHQPHGSASSYGLLVTTRTDATTTVVLGDAPGELVMNPARTDADVRRFCLSCHTTSDEAAGWDGTTLTVVASGAAIEGIDRVSPSSALRLPPLAAHASADGRSCRSCHGGDYGVGGSNVHAPDTAGGGGRPGPSAGPETPTPSLPQTPSAPSTEQTAP